MSGTPCTPQTSSHHQRTPSIMSASTTTIQSQTPNGLPKSRFPRLQECAHFHYEVSTVDIPRNFRVLMCRESDEKNSSNNGGNQNGYGINSLTSSTIAGLSNGSSHSGGNDNTVWFQLQVTSNDKKWNIYRTNENFKYLDKFLHDCIFDRKFSCLEEPVSFQTLINGDVMNSSATTFKNNKTPNSKSNVDSNAYRQIRNGLTNYLDRFCEIAFVNAINCGPILNWFEIDNKGNRLFAIDDSPINIPGVAAAVVKKRYVAQGLDEISLEVGNMISVIDMPPTDESSWWRGKKALEVGFFPVECVELIKSNQHLSSQVTDHLPQVNTNQSVRMKHGKLVTILRGFFNTRPARMHLQSKGILKQRVFACDLGEHLSNTQQNVPRILKICTEFIEKHGMVDGIYRHTGLQSNIQRLRNAFDEEKWHEIESETYINDVHSVSSLLKMYFRELPNPLLTFQLYHKFIRAINIEDKIIEIYDVVQQLPPPHYRTLVYLMQHLHKMSDFASETNMNTKNLAIVWAPNLLKSKEMEGNSAIQLDMLHSITLQANISEFLIANADTIFNDKFSSLVRKPDHKSNIAKSYRPISICQSSVGGSKLLSLEEAQDKYRQVGPTDMPKYHTVIEIPDKQKKKQKDKKNNQSTSLTNSVPNASMMNQPPANLQIQQQFETLQQQQQSQLTSSASFHCVSNSTNTTTPTKQPSSQANPSSAGCTNSSPAFKSIFKNFRGSLKQQSANSSSQSSINITNNETDTASTKNQSTPPSNQSLNSVTNSSSLIRTNSGNAFKNTPLTTSVYSMHSPNTDRKHDYSNCISQLQSAAALAKSSIQNTSSPGNVASAASTTNTEHISPAPVLFRNNKFNQSMNSNHSKNLNSNNDNQDVLNSFLGKLNEGNSGNGNSQNQTSNVFSTFNKESPSAQENRKYENNPVPSKRRTIQGPPINSPSSISSFQKPIAPQVVESKPQPTTRQIAPTSASSSKTHEMEKEKKSDTDVESSCGTKDEMQQLVAYINQFEKENISSNVVNVVHNSAYIELTPEQIEKLSRDMTQQDSETKDNNPGVSKLRLSSSSLSSSDDSINNTNTARPPTELADVFTSDQNDQAPALKAPDRRTYVINKIYDNIDNEMEEISSLNTKNLTQDESNHDDEYTKVILNNDALPVESVEPNQVIDESDTNEHIYQNVESDARASLGFDVKEIISKNQATKSQLDQENYRRLSESSNEKNQDENFDSELIELNNQIKQLLITNEQIHGNVRNRNTEEHGDNGESKKTLKPTPSMRPKSVNYQNSSKPCAPPPPREIQLREYTPHPIETTVVSAHTGTANLTDEDPFANNSGKFKIIKSASIDEINQQKYSNPVKQVRHSFRIASNEPVKVNHHSPKSIPLPKTFEVVKSSQSLETSKTFRKQRKTLDVKAPEKKEIIKIETIDNLEELSVKAKIKLMDSIVGSIPNERDSTEKLNERSASASSTDSSTNSSASSSKSPTRDVWVQQPHPPSVMTRSHITHSHQQQQLESNLSTQVLARSMSHLSKRLSNENCAPCEEAIAPELTLPPNMLSNKPKQTLVECMNNKGNILVDDEFNEVNGIFDKMSFDKVANDIMLSKPSQQTLANLKEKRRTVKELMSKFEKN